MLKRFSLVIIILINFSQAFSQTKIGVVGFPQLSGLSNTIPFKSDIINNHNIPTFTGGAGIQFVRDSRKTPWGFQTGVYYSSQNQTYIFSYTINDESFTHRGKKRFDYIKVPLLLRKTGLIGRYVTSAFFIGGQFSYLLKYDGGAVVYKDNEYFDLPATTSNIYYKTYSIDAVIGFSFEYAMTKHIDLFTAVKFDYGLNNIENTGLTYNNVPVFTGSGSHQMTLALQLGAYYVFHRKDHLLLPTNLWRWRAYKKRKKSH